MPVRWKGWPTLISVVCFATIKGWGGWGLLGASAPPPPAGCDGLSWRARGRQCPSQWAAPAMNLELLSDVTASLGFAAVLDEVRTCDEAGKRGGQTPQPVPWFNPLPNCIRSPKGGCVEAGEHPAGAEAVMGDEEDPGERGWGLLQASSSFIASLPLGGLGCCKLRNGSKRFPLCPPSPAPSPQAVSHPCAWCTPLLPCPRAGRGARTGGKGLQHLGGA